MKIEAVAASDLASEVCSGELLTTGWQLCESPPGAWPDPAAAERAMCVEAKKAWTPCQVPGTVAQALHAVGAYDLDQPRPLHGSDFWYRREVSGVGAYVLRCEGLATLAEVFLDGRSVACSSSMYLPVSVTLNLAGRSVLHLVFRSLNTYLASLKLPRARWRVAMVPNQSLRGVRTTLLGHMPSWCPDVHVVGPWQAIRLIPADGVLAVQLHASVVGEGGRVRVEITSGSDLSKQSLACAGVAANLRAVGGQTYVGDIEITQVQRWWPQGMGAQVLYEVTLELPEGCLTLGKVGFRSIELDRGADGCGFTLVVNGHNMFARGAVYTPPDMLHPGGEEGLAQRLQLLVDMGANMVRVAGPFCYESSAFYRHCDALGLLVWQDLMLANFDYPLADEVFAATLEKEIEVLLQRIAGAASLAVLCGGSEIHQQATMLGLPSERRQLRFFSERLPQMCAVLAPQLIVVPNSPYGGDLPFSVRKGVSHYFGVGAYERPLEDARRAEPRFVTECLAFSNVPEPISLESLKVPAVHHPDWKVGVPRDRMASWDFEDTRDHYLERVFGLHPAQLRRSDPSHYLAASRAVVAHVVGSTIAEWRRPASPTRGALVFTAGDVRVGAGWGLIDVSGEPKSPYYAFRQAAKPLALFLSDEGCDGLDIHLINDTPQVYTLILEVRVLRQGALDVARGELRVDVPAHEGLTVPATRIIGAFFDLTYAFRFGEAGHDFVHVSATGVADSKTVSLDTGYFPGGPYATPSHLNLRVQLQKNGGIWALEVSVASVGRFVHIDDRTHRPEDNYFHLPPGMTRRVALLPRFRHSNTPPQGTVTALNATDTVHYKGML